MGPKIGDCFEYIIDVAETNDWHNLGHCVGKWIYNRNQSKRGWASVDEVALLTSTAEVFTPCKSLAGSVRGVTLTAECSIVNVSVVACWCVTMMSTNSNTDASADPQAHSHPHGHTEPFINRYITVNNNDKNTMQHACVQRTSLEARCLLVCGIENVRTIINESSHRQQ